MASGLAALGAAFAVAGGWIGPGLAAATALGLGRDRLERAVFGVAIGRVLLAVATLAATGAGAGRVLAAWAALGLAAGGWAVARSRRTLAPTRDGVGVALAVGAGCALLLLDAVVLRSGLDRAGTLAFFGRDSANDPFVYGAHALALRDRGLPLANPFAGGAPVTGSYVPFAVLAGLSAIGAVPMTDLVYRVVPLVECAALMATAIALVRALGASARAAWLAPLALLAGDLGPIAAALARLAGSPVHAIDSFALFGPYLLAVNPITPGLQTLFCAWILFARAPRRAEAVIAGLLVAALFEIKVFLWAPAIAGLAAIALLRPPPASRAALRTAALAAAIGSLPSLGDKLLFAARAAARDETGFSLCVGCLPRYLARAAWGDGELSFAIFRAGTPLAPLALAAGALAALAIGAIALGARALALPKLVRGARRGDVPSRWLAVAGAVGFALAMTVGAPPHYLNAAQFAWVAVRPRSAPRDRVRGVDRGRALAAARARHAPRLAGRRRRNVASRLGRAAALRDLAGRARALRGARAPLGAGRRRLRAFDDPGHRCAFADPAARRAPRLSEPALRGGEPAARRARRAIRAHRRVLRRNRCGCGAARARRERRGLRVRAAGRARERRRGRPRADLRKRGRSALSRPHFG
jgi:hypothetical protein